jgi:spore maturation protein CgeB
VTLQRLRSGEHVGYVGARGLTDFDLVLSYTGGAALTELCERLGARAVAPLYGSVDPDVHQPGPPGPFPPADLSYIGTYAGDRQAALDELFLEPARRLPLRRFAIAGSLYPDDFPWLGNVSYVRHLPPPAHAAFYASSALTLNVTREAMATTGYCPSGRLFEAAACGTAILSDYWPGLETFFTPDEEILIAHDAHDAVAAIERGPQELAQVAAAARARVLDMHTAEHRARDFERAVDSVHTIQVT